MRRVIIDDFRNRVTYRGSVAARKVRKLI